MPERVLILGGGPAGLVAAFELSELALGGRFDITVVQQGWRLGGKCASSRNAARAYRNEEHGLHVWFGFYENCFATLNRVYAAHPSPPYPDAWSAFFPRPYTVLGGGPDGNPERWTVEFPNKAGRPGDGTPIEEPVNLVAYLVQALVSVVKRALAEARAGASLPAAAALVILEAEFELATRAIGALTPATLVDKLLATSVSSGAVGLIDKLADVVDRVILALAGSVSPVNQLLEIADIGRAILIGLFDPVDRAMQDNDLDVLDKYELKDWLRRHGCRKDSLDSTFIRAVYEAFFEYDGGDRTRPNYAAGTAVRVLLRCGLGYKGDVLYLPRDGFGEVIMAPLYEVLKARGVKFKFFHRVTSLELDALGQKVEKVVLSEQARLAPGLSEYAPLDSVVIGPDTVKHWPVEPRWAQIDGGRPTPAPDYESYWDGASVGTTTLVDGADFDKLILAIPVTALREVAAPLMAARGSWRALVDGLRPVPNIALQVWADQTTAQLGWARPPALDAGPSPFDVWTEMNPTLAREDWGPGGPKSLHYLCGVFKSDLVNRPRSASSTLAESHAEARKAAIAFLETEAHGIWPGAYAPGHVFRWETLHDPAGGYRTARLDAQFLKPNVDPSEVTHLSPPGTTDLRFYAGDTGFANLAIAGDWARTGINSACVEGAFMSGRQAARALIGSWFDVPGEAWMSRRPHLASGLGRPQPPYVDWVGRGEQCMPGPGAMTGAKLTVFETNGNLARMQFLVDRYLNNVCGTPNRWQVFSRKVLVSFMDATMTTSGAAIGKLPDRECAVWMMLREGPNVRFWMPYIVVDTSIAMVTGRETWGFQKEYGRVEVLPDDWRALGTVFDPMAATTVGREEELVGARRLAPGSGGLISSITAFAGAVAGSLVAELLNAPQPVVVNLKQFRDAADPARACYQSIVQSNFRIDNFHGGRLLTGPFELRFADYGSHRIASDLGVPPLSTPSLAAQIEMDFTALPGMEAWRFR